MNSFRLSLDRYLTREPEDHYTPWTEALLDSLPDDLYREHEDWLIDSDECNDIMNKLFDKGMEAKKAGVVLQRLIKLYKIKKPWQPQQTKNHSTNQIF